MSKVKICTSEGDMVAELYNDATPNTVNNFLSLAHQKFYDNTTFHRVIPNFMAQAGCPFGNGTGGPGYCIPCELNNDKQFHDQGVLSMAHAGRDTGGSQFFICHNRGGVAHLDGNHTCFGKVVEGLDVLDKIQQGSQIISVEILA
jgi:peptidyl-prolyl cis-trans isomerase B (cyclophilin B)